MFRTVSIALVLLIIMSGCSPKDIEKRENDSVQEDHLYEAYPIKEITIENFAAAILEEGTVVPGEGSIWGTKKDTFIDQVYGSALVDESSEAFQTFRTSTNKSGITTIEPPLEIKLANIDEEYFTKISYVFDETDNLCGVNYRYLIEDTKKDTLDHIIKNLIFELNDTSNQLSTTDIVDIERFNYQEDKLIMTWFSADQKQYIRVAGISLQGVFILDIYASNQP